jgi:hypothetical protein
MSALAADRALPLWEPSGYVRSVAQWPPRQPAAAAERDDLKQHHSFDAEQTEGLEACDALIRGQTALQMYQIPRRSLVI